LREQATTNQVFILKFASSNINHTCLDTDSASQTAANWLPIANNGSPDNLSIGASNYDQTCVKDGKYFIDFTSDCSSSAGCLPSPNYLVTVRWVPIGSGPNSKSQLYYRF
jgi:hypothetical protein